jgi:hypothetical protein
MKRIVLMLLPLVLLSQNSLAHAGCTHGIGWWKVLVCVVWWLVASTLLFFTWNKVIVFLTELKAVKLWQALLFVATVAVLCYPRKYGRSHHGIKKDWKKSGYHLPK